MNLIEILEAVENAPRGNARVAVLAENDTSELRKYLNYSLSPDITFGVATLPERDGVIYEDGALEWQAELYNLADNLAERKLTGNLARETIKFFFETCSPLEYKWSARLLAKDLRLDFDSKSVNKALPGCIPTFSVPLATDYAKVKPKDLLGKWIVEPKLDGARTVVKMPKNGGKVQLLSRTGKAWKNFKVLEDMLDAYNQKANNFNDCYLDTEVIVRVNGKIDFQAAQSVLMARDGEHAENLEMIVFDAATGSDWCYPTVEYIARYNLAKWDVELINRLVPESLGRINIISRATTGLECDVVNPDIDCLVSYCKKYVEDGYEGAMFRRADRPVENKRSKSLLKVKAFQDDEAVVVGAIEGTGKYVGMLGALKCKTKSGAEFDMGSGFNDLQRTEIWAIRDNLPKLASFKFFEITNDSKPRFPIFKGFRAGEDI